MSHDSKQSTSGSMQLIIKLKQVDPSQANSYLYKEDEDKGTVDKLVLKEEVHCICRLCIKAQLLDMIDNLSMGSDA